MSTHVRTGFLNINKPLQLTSHDVVATVRRRYRAQTGLKKVGHAGTLDPLADGVLVICLGAATRLSEYIMPSRKTYRARITLGATTSTDDAAGEILTRNDARHITPADIESAIPRFLGETQQIPPMYSAIKLGGKKLYELARKGETVARPPRKVTIHAIELVDWCNPVLELKVHCGAGTYIRSLARDLGEALATGAYLSGLTRLASGIFKLTDSIALDAICHSDNWVRHIISTYDALRNHKRITLPEPDCRRLRQGGFIRRPQNPVDDSHVFAFDAYRQLVAVLEPREALWKPRKVFPSMS